MSLRYEQSQEEQKRFKIDDDGFAYIEEDALDESSKEEKDSQEKDRREDFYARFSSGKEVSVTDPENPGQDFKGFLVSGVEAFRHGKKVRGGVKAYTFWKESKDGKKETEIYKDGRSVPLKSGDDFFAKCADENPPSKSKKKKG